METNTSSSSGFPPIKYVPLFVPLLALLQLLGTLIILVGVLGGCTAIERHPGDSGARGSSIDVHRAVRDRLAAGSG
jgi:hypothetical protein